MKNIGEVISVLRKQKGITQEDLGNLTGLSRVTIAKIENSQRTISLEEAIHIAQALSVDVDALYGFIQVRQEKEDETFVMAFEAKGMDSKGLKEVKRIELLIDALFAQTAVRGEKSYCCRGTVVTDNHIFL